jgi:hypothetical protein
MLGEEILRSRAMTDKFRLSPNDLSDVRLVAKGNDSHVHRIGGKAIKVYRLLNPGTLERYLSVLPHANDLIRNYEYQRRLLIGSGSFRIRFDAIDIEDRGTLDGISYTVSPYSSYPNLDVLSWPKHLFETYIQRSFAHATDETVSFLAQLNLVFLNERPSRLYDEFLFAVDLLSRRIDAQFGHNGHYIGKYNAKVVPDISAGQITLLITDTAVYIDRVAF